MPLRDDASQWTRTSPRSPEQHVAALDADGRVWMAHPFASHHEGGRVESGGRVWWGNCAWDGLGIVHALGSADETAAATRHP